jgi:serine/threonine protein kinase
MWKIADFGISAEGTARRAQTTVWARGTASYRAAELLKEDSLTYTNKVDIWAMACIFYEVAFQKKAFKGDMAVLSYTLSKEPPELPSQVQLETSGSSLDVDTASREALKNILYPMWDLKALDWPTATLLGKIFSISPDQATTICATSESLNTPMERLLADTSHGILTSASVVSNLMKNSDEKIIISRWLKSTRRHLRQSQIQASRTFFPSSPLHHPKILEISRTWPLNPCHSRHHPSLIRRFSQMICRIDSQ